MENQIKKKWYNILYPSKSFYSEEISLLKRKFINGVKIDILPLIIN